LWGMEKKQAVNNLRSVSEVVSDEQEGCILYQHLFPVDVSAYFRQEGTLNRTRTSYSSQLFLETETSLTLSFNWVNKPDYVVSNSWRYFSSTRHRQFALFTRVDIPARIIVFCFSFCLLNDITKKIAILRRVTTCSLINFTGRSEDCTISIFCHISHPKYGGNTSLR